MHQLKTRVQVVAACLGRRPAVVLRSTADAASVRSVLNSQLRFSVGDTTTEVPSPTWRCPALDYAIWLRYVRDGRLIHHSDKGCIRRMSTAVNTTANAPW